MRMKPSSILVYYIVISMHLVVTILLSVVHDIIVLGYPLIKCTSCNELTDVVTDNSMISTIASSYVP